MPAAAFLSAMPSPDTAEAARPWRRQSGLGAAAFQDECRAWGISAAVFEPGMWRTYEPLLRADFRLFDEYELLPLPPPAAADGGSGGAAAAAASDDGHGEPPCCAPFDFPVTVFWGGADARVTRALVEGWARFVTKGAGRFEIAEMAGAAHLWPIGDRAAKAEWLRRIVARIEAATAAAEGRGGGG